MMKRPTFGVVKSGKTQAGRWATWCTMYLSGSIISLSPAECRAEER